MSINNIHVEINLSKLELKLLEAGKTKEKWPICVGGKESITPKGIFYTSIKITEDSMIHLIYRRYLRRHLIKLPFYQGFLNSIKRNPAIYGKVSGKSTYIKGGVITLKNEDGNYVDTSIHGWYNFKEGETTEGCIRLPSEAIETLLGTLEEGTPVYIN